MWLDQWPGHPLEAMGRGHQIGEQVEHFGAGLCTEPGQSLIPRVEAFSRPSVRKDDLMIVEQEVDISDLITSQTPDPRLTQQALRRGQTFTLASCKEEAGATYQNAMLGRQGQITPRKSGAKGVALYSDRLQVFGERITRHVT